jgi:predicted DNA binding CopG/RHH family protein
MMSEKKNQATLTIMNQKNVLMNNLIAETETRIKKFASATNNDYQKLIRSLILEVRIV